MRANLSYLVLLLIVLISFKNVQANLLNTESILCRSCGCEISSSKYIFSKSSPKSYDHFIDNLFGNDEVLVEVFLTALFFRYPVITFYHTACVAVGEWEVEASWYPGYRWKPCVCPECGEYIGWVFEPIHSTSVEPSETFYGLSLNSLVSEICKYDYFLPNDFVGSGNLLVCFVLCRIKYMYVF